MTEQEAIKYINQNICTGKGSSILCADSCVRGVKFCAFSMAIKALEKQIPMKPYYEADGYWNGELVYDTWDCPNCSKTYEVDDEYDFCPKCGQRLDRSDIYEV